MNTLHVKVESLADSLSRATQVMRDLESGRSVNPYQGINFNSIGKMLSAFTPKRWELIEQLRQLGAVSIKELAQQLKRDYKNVHTDVSLLVALGVIEKTDEKLIYVPYEELIFDVKLNSPKAA